MRQLLCTLCILLATALRAQAPGGVVPKGLPDAPAASQPTAVVSGPQAELEVPDRELQVGEAFTMKVKIPLEGEFTKLSAELPKEQSGAILIEGATALGPKEFEIAARTIKAGPQALGPLKLEVTAKGEKTAQELATQAFQLKVEELGQAKEEETPAAYTGPLALPFNYLLRNLVTLLAVGAVIALAGGLLWLLARYMARRRELAAYRPPVPPVDQALTTVRSLKSLTIFHAEGAEAHYTRLSQALRFYFEHQLGRPALEMTEDEVIDMVRDDLAELPKADQLSPVLRRSSMAKFARQEQAEKAALADCESVESFLMSERLRIEVEAQRAAARAASGEAGRSAA